MTETRTLALADDGTFPNSTHPLVLHGGAAADPDAFARTFAAHGWTGGWRGTVFPFHHYHSTAHEVLGVFAGGATLRLGGDAGETVDVAPGDVVVIPAGVAHQCLDDRGLAVVAAYDRGRSPDLLRGEPGERPDADERIAAVPVPDADPLLGPGAGAALWASG